MEYVDLFLVHCPMAMPPGDTDFPTDHNGELMFEDERTDITETWKVCILDSYRTILFTEGPLFVGGQIFSACSNGGGSENFTWRVVGVRNVANFFLLH